MSSPCLVPTGLLEQFWSECAVDSRLWLRCQMNSFLDPLFDDLFDQLGSKFVDYMSGRLNYNAPDIQGGAQNEILSSAPNLPNINVSSNSHIISNNNIYEPQVVVKEEPRDIDIQSNHNLINSEKQEELFDECDDEDCDCDDCLNGNEIPEIKEEIEDYNEDWVEDLQNGDEGTSNKRLRIDDDVRPKNDDKNKNNNEQQKLIALSLQCPEPNCYLNFPTRDQLNDHLQLSHSILASRCFVKDCNQSFYSNALLSHHLRQAHPQTTNWECGRCAVANSFKSYTSLYNHFYSFHQQGKFQCSYPQCTFLSEVRTKVYEHYRKVHQADRFVCNYSGCGEKFNREQNLNSHRRVHLGIAPYRCMWPGCAQAYAARSTTNNHIRRAHFKTPISRAERLRKNIEENRNPNDYVEVLQDLL